MQISKALKRIQSVCGMACLLAACSPVKTVDIHNPFSSDRRGYIAEVDLDMLGGGFSNGFAVEDRSGKIVAHQLTHDKKLLFEADVPAGTTVRYKIRPYGSAECDTVCLAQVRYDFQDDLTWENDKGGYRLYGPAYRNGGGNVSGYDIWTKSVVYPVLSQRYFDHCRRGISYHKDHGNGMDAYTVGRTLGAGMNVLVEDGSLLYPCAYESCEILDNGPLRTSFRINCYPVAVGGDTVRETRVITLDKGSWLNKTTVRYFGLKSASEMANGIVIHKQNSRGYSVDADNGVLAYADLTDNADNGNGVIYIGVVNTVVPVRAGFEALDQQIGDAIGQIMVHTVYAPGDDFTYYWGSGWSKGGVKGMEAWESYLRDFRRSIDSPLEIKIK